ncbi:hypothetical protein ACRQ5Q_08455 [Bradyrhizobium sp. PMVTL-01]|uniref:hypothetical protein n=1 Tax=Bradyrhizobium sp. PMVTL-01 TaxID=3434999 RepID=UPI003F72F620
MARPALQVDADAVIGRFSAVAVLLRRAWSSGLRIATASFAKKYELKKIYHAAAIADRMNVATWSEDVDESKPAPDILDVVLKKLDLEGWDAMAIVNRSRGGSANFFC